MAEPRWLGEAIAISQVNTITVGGAPGIGNTISVTMNSKTISYVLTGTDTNTTAATALYNLLIVSTNPGEFLELTWANPSAGVITATATTLGKPFTQTSGATGGSQTCSTSTTTTSSGPNDVAIGANWSTGVIPANGDNIWFDTGSSACLYSLNQSGVTPNSVNVLPGYTGDIGLQAINEDNAAASYAEYRPQYLQYGATTINISGGGGRIKLDNGSTAVTWNIDGTAKRDDPSVPTLLLKGTSTTNALYLTKGDVGLAWYAGEAVGLGTLSVSYQSSPSSDATLWVGAGVTFTNCTVTQTGGKLYLNSSITSSGTYVNYGGKCWVYGAAAVAGMNIVDGSVFYSSTGTLSGTVKVAGKGTLDFSQDMQPKTVSGTIQLYGTSASILDPNKVVGSLSVKFNETQDKEQVNFGTDFTLTRS